MTRIKISILALIAILFASISCSKESVTEESENIVNKEEKLLLKEAYGFENITQNVNKSNVEAFKSYNLNKLTNKSNSSEELDLTKITQINWNNNKTSYLIPFVNNPKKTIIILVDNTTDIQNIDFSKGTVVENNLDPTTGNGNIIITTQEGTVKKSFEDGVLIVNMTSKTFRQCFDDAYNAICDGAIGCASWYSSPLPALTSVAYCAATTSEKVYLDEPLPLDDQPFPTLPVDDEPFPTIPGGYEPSPTLPILSPLGDLDTPLEPVNP